MERKSFADMDCSVAQCLEVVGEWWSMLIVRDAFMGVTRFEDFQRRLGISRNILQHRLTTLVEAGVLVRVPYSEHPPTRRLPAHRQRSRPLACLDRDASMGRSARGAVRAARTDPSQGVRIGCRARARLQFVRRARGAEGLQGRSRPGTDRVDAAGRGSPK